MLDEIRNLALKGEDCGAFLRERGIAETDLVELYGFTFSDLFHYIRCNHFCKLEGKDVLELGGKLSRPLLKRVIKPKSWTSVGTYYDGEPHSAIGLEGPELTLKPEWNQYCNYSVLAYIKYALQSMNTKSYDVIYSIAAFEHIHKLGTCIDQVSKLLKPGGTLYAYFTSCWMGQHGHHWSRVRSCLGDYDHLIHTESEIYPLLMKSARTSIESDMDVYYMYRGSRINRNTHNDYIKAFNEGQFSKRQVVPIGLKKASEVFNSDQYIRFKQLYPSEEMLCDGYELLFTK